MHKGSKGVLEVDVFMCTPISTSVEGVDAVPAVADMCNAVMCRGVGCATHRSNMYGKAAMSRAEQNTKLRINPQNWVKQEILSSVIVTHFVPPCDEHHLRQHCQWLRQFCAYA